MSLLENALAVSERKRKCIMPVTYEHAEVVVAVLNGQLPSTVAIRVMSASKRDKSDVYFLYRTLKSCVQAGFIKIELTPEKENL